MAIPAAQQPIKIASTSIDVTEHSADFTCVLADVSTSGNGTGAVFAPVIPVNSWTASWPLDDANLPAALGMVEGSAITLKLRVGGTAYILTGTTVESVRISSKGDSGGDAVRVMASGKGGVRTTGAF